MVYIIVLARFMQNPPRHYLQKQFNVYYHEDDVLLMDHELFGFDQLTKWGVQDTVMTMTQDEIDAYKKTVKKSGKVPLHNFGEASIDIVVEAIAELKERVEANRDGLPRTFIDLKFELDNTNFTGKVDGIYGNKFISVCNSSDNLKYLLKSFIVYLGLVCNGNADIDFVFIAKDMEDVKISAGKITEQEARALLSIYLAYFKEGHGDYFYFYPAIGQKDMLMISDDYNTFWDIYSDAKEDDRSFIFEDEYLNTAVQHGFFSEDAFNKIRENVKTIFNPIKVHFPTFFIAPQKR